MLSMKHAARRLRPPLPSAASGSRATIPQVDAQLGKGWRVSSSSPRLPRLSSNRRPMRNPGQVVDACARALHLAGGLLPVVDDVVAHCQGHRFEPVVRAGGGWVAADAVAQFGEDAGFQGLDRTWGLVLAVGHRRASGPPRRPVLAGFQALLRTGTAAAALSWRRRSSRSWPARVRWWTTHCSWPVQECWTLPQSSCAWLSNRGRPPPRGNDRVARVLPSAGRSQGFPDAPADPLINPQSRFIGMLLVCVAAGRSGYLEAESRRPRWFILSPAARLSARRNRRAPASVGRNAAANGRCADWRESWSAASPSSDLPVSRQERPMQAFMVHFRRRTTRPDRAHHFRANPQH